MTIVPLALRMRIEHRFLTRSGQMYDVNGLPPTVTSTRRALSFGVTATACGRDGVSWTCGYQAKLRVDATIATTMTRQVR